MAWRVAQSLTTLLNQLNARYPDRSTRSDGSIGDTNHLAEGWDQSDHNPWWPPPHGGVVTARDFTHDPGHGIDISQFSNELAASRDPRIKYIIANGFILDSRPGNQPWQWVRYTGSNPHDHHVHLSVMGSCCDDGRPWNLPMFTTRPTVTSLGVLDMPMGVIPPGPQVTQLVMPIGPSVSKLVAHGWLSLSSSENAPAGHVWIHGPHGLDRDVPLAKNKRWWIELPDGTDQMTIHTDSPGSVGWCLELSGQ